MSGYVQGMIDFERRNLEDDKLNLASKYGRMINNGKTKQNN